MCAFAAHSRIRPPFDTCADPPLPPCSLRPPLAGSIAGDRWEEKQAGVLGLLLLKSPGLRVIEFTGSLHYSVLREVVKYCQHLAQGSPPQHLADVWRLRSSKWAVVSHIKSKLLKLFKSPLGFFWGKLTP